MPSFSFRLRVRRSHRVTIDCKVPSLVVEPPAAPVPVVFRALKQEDSIQAATQWVLTGKCGNSEVGAHQVAELCGDIFLRTLTRLRVGVDYGARGLTSCFTEAGLAELEKKTGKRVLNDVLGLAVYPDEPEPLFASIGPVRAWVGMPEVRFYKVFQRATESSVPLSDRDRLSHQLFHASFFQASEDARFLLLVMATEALIESPLRSATELEHVDAWIKSTTDAVGLQESEKVSLRGSLEGLRHQSIRRAGSELAETRLGDRRYDGSSAAQFFKRCYDLRSNLVHASPPVPSLKDIGAVVHPLEVFVSDLLSGDLVEVEA